MLNGECYNGECYNGEKLLDYDCAGFEITINGKEVTPAVTNVANTSFIANGEEISIADYSREEDFFFLANTLFAKELVEKNAEITATPFVKLIDGTTIKGKTVSFKLGDLK